MSVPTQLYEKSFKKKRLNMVISHIGKLEFTKLKFSRNAEIKIWMKQDR